MTTTMTAAIMATRIAYSTAEAPRSSDRRATGSSKRRIRREVRFGRVEGGIVPEVSASACLVLTAGTIFDAGKRGNRPQHSEEPVSLPFGTLTNAMSPGLIMPRHSRASRSK
jgi:hypothetical protein